MATARLSATAKATRRLIPQCDAIARKTMRAARMFHDWSDWHGWGPLVGRSSRRGANGARSALEKAAERPSPYRQPPSVFGTSVGPNVAL